MMPTGSTCTNQGCSTGCDHLLCVRIAATVDMCIDVA